MGDVVPSFLGGTHFDNDAFGKVRMMVGEVQAMYHKNHPKNVSKKFTEYQVCVKERVNNTAVSRMYEHVIQRDLFGGKADTFHFTYRPDTSAKRDVKDPRPALGSKVLLMCINGEVNSAVIVGGIRDANGEEDDDGTNGQGDLGHHMHFRFNGIDFVINNDGELTLTYQGAQKIDGTPADGVDVDKMTGTTVKITKEGNFTVADKDSKNVIQLDHANGKILITSENEVVTTAPKIKHGSADSDEPHVLGNQLNDWVQKFVQALASMTVMTGVGPSSPPVNIQQFQQLAQQFQDNLSETSFTEK
jgi:hypothetical protein